MNIPQWIPWKPEKFPSSFPLPRRAPYGVNAVGNCRQLKTAIVIYTCNTQNSYMK